MVTSMGWLLQTKSERIQSFCEDLIKKNMLCLKYLSVRGAIGERVWRVRLMWFQYLFLVVLWEKKMFFMVYRYIKAETLVDVSLEKYVDLQNKYGTWVFYTRTHINIDIEWQWYWPALWLEEAAVAKNIICFAKIPILLKRWLLYIRFDKWQYTRKKIFFKNSRGKIESNNRFFNVLLLNNIKKIFNFHKQISNYAWTLKIRIWQASIV